MRSTRLWTCLSGLVATVVLTACGDDGSNSSATGTATQGTSTNTTPGTTSTSSNPTTSDSGTATDTASGTMGETQGQTTGTSAPTTTSPTGSTTDEPMTGTSSGTTGTTGTTGPISSTTDGTTSTTTNNPGDCMPGDTQGMGDVEKSYLWVANSDQGTISKVDTQAVVEIARYRSGPNGANYADDPSRTAVSVDGRFVVVNNRLSGYVTMIAANLEDCVDKNGNGMIDTSQSPADIRPWMQDECIRWATELPSLKGNYSYGPRGVTWTPGTWDKDLCTFVDPKVWVGYLPPQLGTAHMARLDGQTGVIEETVIVPNWIHGWTDYSPYGAALDKDFNVWFTGLRGELFKIDTGNGNTLSRWLPPNFDELYGMTVDPDGDPWFGNCSGSGVSTFNPLTQQFTTVPGTDNGSCYRGLAADKDGHVWVASNFQCGVMQIDHVTNTMVQFHTLQPCNTPVGVSVDDEGFVWIVDEWQGAWKIDPINPNNKQFLAIANDHYTYSDMTGGQLKSVVLPQ